jgi:hypothetical protein
LDWNPQDTRRKGQTNNDLTKNKGMGTANGWKKLKRGKRTSLRWNQMEELHESPLFHIRTKE